MRILNIRQVISKYLVYFSLKICSELDFHIHYLFVGLDTNNINQVPYNWTELFTIDVRILRTTQATHIERVANVSDYYWTQLRVVVCRISN
jgi:hypothetical protein